MNEEKKRLVLVRGRRVVLALLIFFEIAFFVFLGTLFLSRADAGVGSPNTTVITRLSIGEIFPEILSIYVYPNQQSITLIANNTNTYVIQAIVRDYNGGSVLQNARLEFFDNSSSSYGGAERNTTHYTNNSCTIDPTYNPALFLSMVNCSVSLWYNTDPGVWNMTVRVNDSANYFDIESNTTVVNSLLAIGLPNIVDYGNVNATNVSEEQMINVTNYGNVRLNLSLQGYAYNLSDNLSMNCSSGALKNISVGWEKFNLTTSFAGTINLAQFTTNYTNLTGPSIVRSFGLNFQHTEGIDEAWNSTFWRIYVPRGVAGNCSGNIQFGATVATGI